MTLADKLATQWHDQIQTELPNLSQSVRTSIIQWLLGETPGQLETLDRRSLVIAERAMDYRYRILRDRYLDAGPERAYRNLINRLSGLFMLRNKISTWIALSRDRSRTVVDVLQEVVQELMQQDSYLQQQVTWITQCTSDKRLRNALMLAATEEYCLRPIRNQPLLLYRFMNYLRRSQRGGMTNVPTAEFIRLISEEISGGDEGDGTLSLIDMQTAGDYQQEQLQLEQQEARDSVVNQLGVYLQDKIGDSAVTWLTLYLKGETQEAIAANLEMPIKEVYRLREKVSYHAVKVFAAKKQPELVAQWLAH